MKTGRTLSELATELERQNGAKKDYIADTRKLSFRVATSTESPAGTPSGAIVLDGVNGGMELKDSAHAQMSAALAIPKVYYDRLRQQAPDLLAQNVNHWLTTQPAKRLIRTMDNRVRALLSDSYRPLDNYELAQVAIPQLMKFGARVESSEITDSRLYIKAITERIQGIAKVGQTLYAGVSVSNSEIGHGKLRVDALDFNLACLNGMISERAIGKAHIGRSNRGADVLEDAREFYRSETRQIDDRAFFMKVSDTIGAMFDQTRFEKRLSKYRTAAEKMIEDSPADVVEIIAKRFNFGDAEADNVLKHLAKNGDLSVWGYANAVTRAAQDVESYDRSQELEGIGGEIIELPASAWRILPATRRTAEATPSLLTSAV